jgi:Recombinase
VPLIVHAFNPVAAGLRHMEEVRKEVSALGLRTNSGREIPRQSFYNMLRNEIYVGWVVSGDLRVKGLHEPLVSQEVSDTVQQVISGMKPDESPTKRHVKIFR